MAGVTTIADLAEHLGIKPRTVKAVLRTLYLKHGLVENSSVKMPKLIVRLQANRTEPPNLEKLPELAKSIARLASEGLANGEIAEATGISEMVVKNYLRKIYDELGVWNRKELILRCS